MKFNTIDELLSYTEKIKGKSLNDIIKEKEIQNDNSMLREKGILGNLVETEFYEYPNNNISEADFHELGVELKTSGITKTKKGKIRAKERLVLSMINFNEIVNETFENSHLMEKNENILILWYYYKKNIPVRDLKFYTYLLYSLHQDEEVIKNDFKIIQDKVKQGKAEELSEGDTTYLGACRKGFKGTDTRTQPYSDTPAPSRAYCLKQGYMSGIIQDLCQKERLKPRTYKYHSVTEYITAKLKKYYGKTQREIATELKLLKNEKIPKNINKQISDTLIGKDKDLPKLDPLFRYSNFIIKNSPIIGDDFTPKERMSFKNLRLSDFETNWDESGWKQYFEQTTIINICYQFENRKGKVGEGKLKTVKQFSFNDKDIQSIEKTYKMIQTALENYKNKIYGENLDKYVEDLPTPQSFTGQIVEILPKARKGKNSYYTFFENDKDIIKSAFAINKECLKEKLSMN